MRGQFVINVVSSIVLALNPVFVPEASAAPAEKSPTAAPLMDTRVTANAALPDWFTRPAAHAETAAAITPVPAPSTAASEQTAETAVLPAWFTTPAQQSAPISASASPRQQPPRAPVNSPRSAPIAYLYVTIMTPTNSVSVGNLGGDAYRIYVSNMIGVTNAYTLNVTATLPSGFSLVPDSSQWTYRAADMSQHSISHTVFITDNVITWEPTTPLNLLMGEYTDISFKLATSCGVQSAQLLSAFANYSDSEGPGTTAGYVNVTTGRGNLVIEQTPSLQDARYGDMVTWTIKARNTGLGNVYSATVEALPDASFTDVNDGSLPFTIDQLAPNEFRSYTVSARVNACSPLRNTAAAYWSCGNVDNTATSTTPVSTSASVKFLLEVPNVSLAVTPNPVRVPYCTNTTPVTVTVNNTGGPALDLILRSNLNSLGASANIVSGSPFTYDAVTGIFSYTGGTPVGLLNRSTSTTLTFNVNQTAACNASNGLLSFAPSFADACDVPFDLPTRNTTYQYGNDAPTLIVTSTAPNSTYAGEQVVFTVLLNAANTQNLAEAIAITDVVPGVFSVTAASVTTGTLGPIGQTLTWTVSPDGSPVSAILLITTTASSGINQCLSFASSTNVVTATAPVNCAGCNPLISTASSTVIGQNVPGTQYAKTTSGPSEVCSDISFTNHYSLSQVTWAGTFFTESLGTGSLVTSLNYISGSLQIMVNGVDRTADVTIAQTAPRLVLDFSGMSTPTETVDFTITYQARVPDAALGGSVYRTYFDWSQLTVGGAVGDESCKADRTFYQGLYLTIYRGDLTVAISPASADACAITPVVLTVSGGRADRVTGNVVVTFTAPADEFASLNVTGFGGAFAGNPVVTTTAGNVITWTFANPINSNGTINLTIKRSCSSTGTWQANVSFTDQCGVTYTNATANTPTTYNPNLVLFLTPSRYNLTANVARWRIYLTNNGSGVGTNVLVTDTLGAGLQFITYTTSDPAAGIALQQNGNQLIWTIATLDPAEQRWIDVSAQAIGCSNLTSVVTATLGCNGSTCASQTKNVDFLTFSASLLTSNGQTADLPLCGVGTVVLTTKNTSGGGSAIYNLTLSETLTNLTYVSGSAVVTVIDDTGHVVTSTTAFQPITSTPYVTSTLLVWSHEAAPPGLLDAVSAGYIVSVTFNVATYCDATSSNSVAAKVSAASACNQFFQRTENAVTLKVADPIFLFDKLGRGPTQASFSPIAVAEPGETVVWRLHVRNSASGYQAQNVWVTDTLPANFVYGSASPAPTNVAGSVISWDLGDVPADGVDRYYYITGTVSTGSCAIGTTNQAVLEYGCDNGCRLSIPIASATLRSQPSMTLLQTPAALSECGGVITLTVQNLGTTAYTFTLTDTLPAGLIFSETISSSTAYSTAPTLGDTALAWTFAALPPGDTQIVFVAKNATGACFAANGANQLSATYTDACGSPPDTASGAQTINALTSNLVVDVSPATQVITPGQTISWTITVLNTGDGDAANVVITDVVGSGFTTLVASDGSNGQVPSIVDHQITYAFPTLDAGATWTAIITGTSITGTQLSYNNVLTASKRCGDGCSQTRTATGFTSPSDRLIKVAAPQPNVRVGEPVTYSLSTSFWGEGHTYNNVIITDTLPTLNALVVISVTGAEVTSTNVANTWLAGSLTGDTISFTTASGDVLGQDIVTAIVYGVVVDNDETVQGNSFINTGNLTYDDSGQSYALVATTTQTIVEPLLALSKAVATSTGSAINLDGNALITYTLRVTNSGTAPAYSIRLTDAVPSGISVTAQFGGDVSSGPIVGANDLAWLINALDNSAPDNVLELTYTARISQALANTNLINVVTGTYRSVPETWPHARSYGPLTDTRSLSTSDVSVEKSAAPTTLRVGDVTTHSLVFTVPAGLIGLGGGTSTLIDTLPVGLAFVTDTETLTWSPAEVTVITTSRLINNTGSQQQVTWYFDAITSTLDQPTVVTLTPQAQATGQQINTGDTVFTPPSAIYTPTNTVALWQRGVFVGSSTAQNRVIQPVLSIDKTVTPTANSYVGSGDLISYTLVVANSSNGPAYNIVISDVLPAGVIYDSSLIENGIFDQQPTAGDTGTIVWHVAALDGTEVATSPRFTVTVYAHVDPNIGANLTLNNSASLPYYDSEPGLGVTTVLGTVQRTYSDGSSAAALRTVNGGIAKSVTFSPPPTATLGTLVTYTLSVPPTPLNVTLYDVQITDTLNPSLTIVGVDTLGLYTVTGQLITATFTSVPSYTQAYVTVTARIDTALNTRNGTVISNTAYMTHSAATVLTSTQTVSTLVGEPTLTMTKQVASSAGSVTAVNGTQTLTYTIRITNTGTSPAYDVSIIDLVPGGVSVTAQFSGTSSSGPVQGLNPLTWTVATISNVVPNNAIMLTYTARISGAVAGGSSNIRLTNTVTSTWTSLADVVTGERSYGPITATAVITTAPATVAKSVSPTSNGTNNLKVGDIVTYALVVTVPPGEVVRWPYLYDVFVSGVRYITNSVTVTSTMPFSGSTPLDEDRALWISRNAAGDIGVSGATATANPNVGASTVSAAQQALELWLDPLDNSTSLASGRMTATFQVQLYGIPLNSTTAQWVNPTQNYNNAFTALWPLTNTIGYTTSATLYTAASANVASSVGNPRLGISKTSPYSNTLIGAGQIITYALVVTNNGTTPAYDVVVSDVLPGGISFISATITSTTPTTVAFTTNPVPSATGTITWTINQLNGSDTAANGTTRFMTMTLWAYVTDTITANLRLTNTAGLPYYDNQFGPGVTTVLSTVQRTYSVVGTSNVPHLTINGGLTKTYTFDPPPTVTLGSLVTYTIKVPTSAISATLYNVRITDTVHPSMTLEPAGLLVEGGVNGAVVYSGQRVTATFDSIAANTFGYVTITARVLDNLRGYAGYVLTNTAYLSHSTASSITNTGVISTPMGEPALSIGKAVATSTGSTTNLDGSALITYTIRVTNSGTSPAYTIRLTDAVPTGISVTAQFGGDVQGGPIVGASDLTWLINSIGNTAPDNVIEVTYTARITQALANTSLINTVQATYWSLTDTLPGVRNYGPISSNRTLNIANLTINKLAAPTTLRVGDVTTYSLVFTVPAGLIGMGSGTSTLIDTLPTGLEFVTDTETLTWSPAEVTVITTSRTTNETGAQQLVTWYFDAITSTLDQPTVVTLTLQAQATGQQINTGATVFSPPSSIYTPINTVALWQRGSFVASSTAQNRVIQPVLTINKTVTPTANSYVGSGDLISYTLVVANNGNGPAYNIVISDVLPAGVIYDSSLIDNGIFDQQPTSGDTDTIVWHVAALDGTEVATSPRFTVTVYAHVHPNIGANLTLNNSASLPYYDSEPGPGVSTVLGTVQRTYSAGSSSAALRTVDSGLAKAVTFSPPPTATLGTLITYTLSVPPTPLNVTLYDVQITDTLHPSMTIEQVDTLGLYTITGQLITATFTSVPSYTQAYVAITARVMDNLGGYAGYALTNTAYLSHSAASAITHTNVVTTLLGEPSLAIGKSSEPAANSSVGAGQTVTYTVLITNANISISSPAYDLLFTDTLPVWMRALDPVLSAITLDGTPVSASDYVTGYIAASGQFSIGFASTVSVPVGSVLRIQYAAPVEATVPSGLALTNQAQMIWTSLAGNVIGERAYGPINTSVTLNTLTPNLSKQATPLYVAPGDLITYTLTAPAAPISATLYNVVITDAFDARTTVIDLTRSGGTGALVTPTASLITATFASVPSYTQALVTATVRVPATLGAVAGDLLFNEAILSDNLNQSHSNSTTVTVTEPSLTLVKASDPISGSLVGASDLVTYSVTLTNRNTLTTSAAHDIVITDTLPPHLRGAQPTIIAITLNGTPIDPADYTTGFNSSTGVYTLGFASNINLSINGTLFVQYAATIENTMPPDYALINVAQAAYDSQAGVVTGERAYVTNLGTTTLHTRLPGISKSVSSATATLGDLITYTLMVPASPVSVTIYDATITDTLNASTAIEAVTAPGGASGWSGQVVTANFATIPAFSTAYVTITARLLSSSNRMAGDLLSNQATLSHTTGLTTSNITQVRVLEPSLTLAKSSNPISGSLINAGESVTYTVNVTNATGANVSAAHDLIITDTLPQYLRGAQPTLITVTLDDTPIDAAHYAISWDAASGVYTATFDSSLNLAPNSTLAIQYAATVENSVPLVATLINRAQAVYSSLAGNITGERAYTTNVATTTLRINLQANLSKTVTPSTATLGDIITYVVRVPAAPIAATLYNVVITDAVHVSTTVESASVSGGTNGQAVFVGQSVTATFDSVPAQTQATLTITARLRSSSGAVAGNTVLNQATLSHSSGLTHSNITSFRVIEPSLSIAKGSTPDAGGTVGAGDSVQYVLFITNATGLDVSTAHDLLITDTLPAYARTTSPGIVDVSINGSSTTDYASAYDPVSGVLTITLGANVSLGAGETLRIDYQAVVDNTVPAAAALINQAHVMWSSRAGLITGKRDYGPISATTTLYGPQPMLGKAATPPIVSLGSTAVFTLSVPGTPLGAVLTNVAVTDTFDSRLRIEATSANATFSGQIVTAAIASIASFAQANIVITATVLNLPTTTNGTSITNVAVLNYATNPGGPVLSPIVPLDVHEPNVTLAKSVTTARQPVGAGDRVTYTLTLNNTGNWPAHDLVITDALPGELAFVATTAINVSDPLSAITGGDYAQWTIDQLNAGGTATIQFTARVANTIGARVTLTNSAWGVYDSQPGANIDQRPYNIVTATATINTGEPMLDLVKSATPSPVNAGDPLHYTIAVTNTGLVTATGVVITDAIPANTTFGSASDPHTLNAGVASWSIGPLGVGASALVTLAVNVNSPLFNNTSILNTAYVTSAEGITDSSALNVPVNAAHTLAIVKTASAEHDFAGRLLTYTLAYTISGNEQALGVTISDTVPPSVTYQACSGAACNETAGLVTWSIGDVTPIGAGVVTLTVLINSDVPTGTLVVNRAAITDSSGLQATSDVTVSVWSLPSFAITKTTEITLAHANRPITYTIFVTNTGLGAATQTVITDELPVSTTFGSCGPLPCTQVGSIVSWTIGTVMPAQSVAVTLAVIANSDVPSDTFLYNTRYGVTCAELPGVTGEVVIVPTNVQLMTFKASAPTSGGNLFAGVLLAIAAAWVWDRRRRH